MVYIFGFKISNFAKLASDLVRKKLAGGIYLQNTRDELQNIKFN